MSPSISNSEHSFAGTSFLVTGAAGFIGSNIIAELARSGCEKIVLLDNLSTGFMENINEFLADSSVTFIQGDIRDPETCRNACENIDVVIHLAALGSIPRSIENPVDTNSVNVDGFLNILNASRIAGVKKFIFASSSSVYGDDASAVKTEIKTGKQLSPYAVSKYANELYAEVFFRIYGLKTVGLRFFNVFGPKQNVNGPYAAVIPIFISRILRDEPCVIYGDGKNTRDFTYVDNVVNAVLKVAAQESVDVFGNVYNVACGESVSVNDLHSMISAELGKTAKPQYAQPRPGEIKNSLADIKQAIGKFAYKPLISVGAGVKLTVDWYRKKAEKSS